MNVPLILKRGALLTLMLALLALFFYFDLRQYLSFQALKQHRIFLLDWTNQHYLLAVSVFMLIYALAIAISIPGAAFFTIVGGFLFGMLQGVIYVVFSATIGATLVFLAVRYALAAWVRESASGWIAKMREGFKADAFQYLLFLRLVPIFPFWVVNIVPALFGISARQYILATFFGIIPGSVVYVMLGSGLGKLFEQGKTPDLAIIYDPQIFVPLLALGILSLLPSLIKKWRKK